MQQSPSPKKRRPPSAELPGERGQLVLTGDTGLYTAPASLPLTLSLPQVNDDVPVSNSLLNLSCLLTQAESQCFLHLPFALMAANLVQQEQKWMQ